MARALLSLIVALAGCSLEIDDSARFLPVVGDPMPLDSLQRITGGPMLDPRVVAGAHGDAWVALVSRDGDATNVTLKMIELGGARRELTYTSPAMIVGKSHLYLSDGVNLHVISPGDDPSSGAVPLPPYSGEVQPNDADTAFLYMGDVSFGAFTTDGRGVRYFDLQYGPNDEPPGPPVSSPSGDRVFTFDGDGSVIAHGLLDFSDVVIGEWPASPIYPGFYSTPAYVADDDDRVLILCDEEGLRIAPYDGSGEVLVDPSCFTQPEGSDQETLPRATFNHVYYWSADSTGGAIASFPLADPFHKSFVRGARRTWSIGASGAAYSTTSFGAFAGHAGDGALGAWRFMERGRDVQFSRDGSRLRWLEHSADDSSVGALYSAELANRVTLPLAFNVSQYHEADSGLVIAVANHGFDHPWNRVVAIDEEARVARVLVEDVSGYTVIPGQQAVLGTVVQQPYEGGLSLVVIPLPAR